MAVVELYDSREQHITKIGSTTTRLFSCSDEDWNRKPPGDGVIALPLIGDKWSDDRPDLCVTDIRNRWRSNTECVVTAIYSRGGFSYPQALADTRSSIEETFDFSFQPIQLIGEDTFWDFVTVDSTTEKPGTGKKWKTHFQETYANIEPPPVPEPGSHIILTSKMNVSTWSWNTIKDSIGKVNDADLIIQYKQAITRPPVWKDVTGNDTGYWLFTGFNATQIGNDNIQLMLTFQHSGIDVWNRPYGVKAMNMYETADFLQLPFPTGESDTVDDGLR